MKKFHGLAISEVRRETSDTVSIALELPDTLRETFKFIPGQYLTFRQNIDGEDIRRSYSICSGINDEDFRVAVKLVPGGKFSTFANNDLKTGDQLEVMPPDGNFKVVLNPTQKKEYLVIAAGSGITPILSIMRSVLDCEPESKITLIYGNRRTESIIFREEIEGLKNKYMGRFSTLHILSRERTGNDLFYGRINQDKIETFSKKLIDLDTIDEIFICGPEEMIHDSSEALKNLGVDFHKIHIELFTTPTSALANHVEVHDTEDRKKIDTEVEIILDGHNYNFPLSSKGENVLDASLRNGLDLPFACKGGVCCTCRAKLVEGEVEMDVNFSLEKEELDRGYILTCQSHPVTKKVVISFDEK